MHAFTLQTDETFLFKNIQDYSTVTITMGKALPSYSMYGQDKWYSKYSLYSGMCKKYLGNKH